MDREAINIFSKRTQLYVRLFYRVNQFI